MRHAFFDLPRPLSLGHRGAAGHAPENTLEGFARGLALGADILETDVHATRDGAAVLLHDDSLDRTTNGAGRVADVALAELETLDAGYWFDAGDASFPFRGQGVRVPTLEQALRAFPAARFNVEIKSDHAGLVGEVVELVDRLGCESRTLLTAGDDDIMAELRHAVARSRANPAIGACTGDIVAIVRCARDQTAPVEAGMALQIPAEFGGRPLATPALIEYAHAHDIQVHVWTINEPEEIERLLDLGADGIVSDYPDRVARIASRRRG